MLGYDCREHQSFNFIFWRRFHVSFSLHEVIKCLCVFCSNGRCDPSQQGFGSVLLKALIDNMPLLPAASTGGMYTMLVVIKVHSMFVVWHVLLDSLVK